MQAFRVGMLAALMAICTGCGRGGHTAVNVVGSTSIHPFAEMLAQEFNKRHPESYVEVQGGGSTMGLQTVKEGIADIGTCSRELKEQERPEFKRTVIALDGLAIVVHPSNPIKGLTREQVREVFAGTSVTNWRQVGGKDQPIRMISREEGSGTREAFMKLVMGEEVDVSPKALTQESNGAVRELVKHDPCAVGYMSLGLVKGELKILAVDGVAPSTETVKNRKYPLWRPFLFVVKNQSDKPTERAKQFIDFVLSPDGQKMLEEQGLVGVAEAKEAETKTLERESKD